jgi:putative PEP-CTERM system TPR-repeat lipoprotein
LRILRKDGHIQCKALILVLVLFFSACTKSPEQLQKTAMERHARGDRVGAVIDMKSAIQQEPNNAAFRFYLGKLYNEVIDPASAEKELRKAVELKLVEGGRVMVELARALRWQNKYAELLQTVKPELAYEPTELATIFALRGRAQLSLGQSDESKESLINAQKLGGQAPDVGLLAAQIAVAHGKLQDAQAIIDKVLEGAPGHFDALVYRAGVLGALGKADAELAAYGQILKSYPTHFGALWSRSMWYLKHGKFAEAQKDVSLLEATYKGNAQVSTQQGLVYLAQGKTKEALERAQVVLKNFPEFPSAQLLLGLAQSELGQHLQAEKTLSGYVMRNPHVVMGRGALATTLIHLKQPRRALDILEPVVNNVTSARYYELAGNAHSLLGEYSKALAFYEKAVKLTPMNSTARFSRAMVQMKTGDVTGGLGTLEEAVSFMGRTTPADEILVLMSLGQGDTERALRAVQNAEARSSDNPIVLNLKGLVYLARGELSLATDSFEKALKTDPQFYPAARNLAQLDMWNGRADMARERYEVVLKSDPRNVDAIIAKSDLDIRQGRVGDAIEALRSALGIQPQAVKVRSILTNLHLSRGEQQQAITVASDGLALAPGDPAAIMLVVETQLAAGNINSATQNAARLTQADPGSPEAFYVLARLQLAAQRTEDAYQSLAKAVSLRPDYAPASFGIAALLVKDGKREQAMEFARKLQREQPKSQLGIVLEGEILEHLNKFLDASIAYRNAFAQKPTGIVAVRIFRVESKLGNEVKALADLQSWLIKNPKDNEVRSVVAFELAKNGNYRAAIPHYETLRKIDPKNAEYANGLAWVYHLSKDSRARSTAEAAYQLAPLTGYTADTLGWILLQEGHVKRALHLLKFALATSPDNPEVRYHLAIALYRSGDSREAKRELSRAIELNKPFTDIESAREMLTSLK